MNYADDVCDWLVEQGYTHCFFVAGGNIMHVLNSARSRFKCVPFVHEVACGIATEYFNEISEPNGRRAFALVTAGPGVTNIVTAIAGAFLESRELLIIGGQVKASDLSRGQVRQRGVQEIDGVSLTKSLCKVSARIEEPIPKSQFLSILRQGSTGRPGPVFIEFCLDAQASNRLPLVNLEAVSAVGQASFNQAETSDVSDYIVKATRPLLLIGGGVSRQGAKTIVDMARNLGIPCATTWNAADRVASDDIIYAGRPNTWGMRWANIVLQQSNLLIAAGTRLGLQQTGFNWREFAPLANIIQIDIDPQELVKGHPRIFRSIQADVNQVLPTVLQDTSNAPQLPVVQNDWSEWRRFIQMVRDKLPLEEAVNLNSPDYVQPYRFITSLSQNLDSNDIIIPSSSGGAFTVTMQAFLNKLGQIIVTNKGLASMGYGLSGAIGAAFAKDNSRVILIEGDGGFAQNIQELGTLKRNELNIKVFIFSNNGYASIRMTQQNYFDGAYIGCDTETGLGLPNWETLCSAYEIPCRTMDPHISISSQISLVMMSPGPEVIVVPIDPAQTYYPKVTSKITESGSMKSNPIHLMTPELDFELADKLFPYLSQMGGNFR